MRTNVQKKWFGIVFLVILCSGCDVYENENPDWVNKVTIEIHNQTICPLYIYLDGVSLILLDPGESHTKTKLGQGIHLLQSYSWEDSRHPCASVFTPDLKNGESYTWAVTTETPCGICRPTPTPVPTITATPQATFTPSP